MWLCFHVMLQVADVNNLGMEEWAGSRMESWLVPIVGTGSLCSFFTVRIKLLIIWHK